MDISLKKHLINITSRERLEDKGNFLKRVGTLLEEGYSLKSALAFLEQIEQYVVLEWIRSIQEGLIKGYSFHEELSKLGFSEKICSQIYFASQYGQYSNVVTQCGEQLLGDLDKKKKLQSLLSYPILLIGFLLSMLLVMRFLIFPHMETLFNTTQNNVNIYSNILVLFIYYSPQIIVLTLLFILLLYVYIKRKLEKLSILERFEIFMKVPILNTYLKDYWSTFFFFEWGQLLKSGCSLQEIIIIMKGEDASNVLKETGYFLAGQMKTGRSIVECLEELPFFHKNSPLIIAHGEKSGNLAIEMLVYASHCQTELTIRVEKLMNKIQPIIFSFVALMIVGIYASLILPIFSLMEGF